MTIPAFASRFSRRVRWFLVAFAFVLLAMGAVLAVFASTLRGELRDRAVALLEERLESDVELEDLQIDLGYVLTVHGRGLVVRHHRRRDVPPLISIDAFSAVVPWSGYFASPRRLTAVALEGLHVTIPPGSPAGCHAVSRFPAWCSTTSPSIAPPTTT
ncbi:MAG: hypothetical protein AB7I50_04015 [Vicinamibacterales bacterium]